ncbi:uncharacterized protein LOC132787092 [Drosophila nasuta]|uniref:uncharacterized protein LOC132787092 n=1 Tax=Drosophila nasuta TaxID=42062 RepID=UPI00295EB587|nr:uncharacterized protein LOC132787092 [Drosophila nasuta]
MNNPIVAYQHNWRQSKNLLVCLLNMMLGFRVLLALLVVAISNHEATGVDHDTMLCSNDNTPMCAQSQGEYLLFKNECDLRKAQRENLMGAPLFDVALHNCVPSCEFECHDGFHPICGVSVASNERKTFRNRCEMARTSCNSKSDWLVYKWGACPSSKSQPKQQTQAAHTVFVGQRKRRRPIPCTNVYRPVCAGYAGVKSTFSNECLVNAENIRTRRNWRVISEGLCGEDSTKMKHSRKYKPKYKPKVEVERSKRSHKQLNQLDDFEISEDAVQIFAPSTFHTQFISNSGTMEKSYSLPARKPYMATMPKSRHIYGSDPVKAEEKPQLKAEEEQSQSKPCVFSNEPVCGSFNGESRTFPNVCALMEYSQAVGHAWTILYDGSCRSCDKPCPTVYSPICANRNGISYTIINECYLERVRCKDPNSDWKITHKGECTVLNDEVSQSIPKPSPKPSSRIHDMLYATKHQVESSSTISPTTTPKAITTSTPRRQLRKPKRPTPTPKDLSNRKIRKIELFGFDGYAPKETQPIKMPVTSKLWSPKDNWLLHQSLDEEKNKYNKKTSHKKAHSEKYPLYNWANITTTPAPTTQSMFTTAATTTTTATTRAPTTTITIEDDITSAEQLMNLETDSEILFMMGTTPQVAEFLETEATTRTSFTLATTAATTPTPTTWSTTTTTPRTTAAITTLPPITEPEAESTIIDDATTEIFDETTTNRSTKTTTSGTSTMSNEISTTQNSDYLTDESLQDQSKQTSIYGLDKNSLIMRLLRARSSKNIVL